MISERDFDKNRRQPTDRGVEQIHFPAPQSSFPRAEFGWPAVVALAAALFLGFGLLGSIWVLARPLALLILGLSIAASLNAPVEWLSRWLPRLVSIVLVHLLILAVLFGLGWMIFPPLASQVRELNDGVPEFFDWLAERAEESSLFDLKPLVNNAMNSLQSVGGQLVALPLAISDGLLDALFVLFLSLYSLMAAPAVRKFILSFASTSRRHTVHTFLDDLVEGMGGYLRGVVITGCFVGVLTYIGLRFIGIPYPVVLAVLAGVLEFVPVIGTTISLLTITGVALTQSPSTAMITFGFMLAVQLVEGNILFPNIVGRQTDSSPLLSIFAFFAGLSVGGIVGGIIGVPLAVVLRLVVLEIVAPAVRKEYFAGAQGDNSAPGITSEEVHPTSST